MTYEPLPPGLDPRGPRRTRHARARGTVARPLGRLLGALLSAALLLAAGYYWYTFRQINNNVSRVDVAVGQAPSNAVAQKPGTAQNILLVGNDDRSTMTKAEEQALHAGESSGSLATDTLIIIHVPADGSRATIISIPRDSWVNIPGFGMDKINAAYVDGYDFVAPKGATLDQRRSAGANLLVTTLQNVTGLTIDHYVQIDLLGFYRISNAIGGITVNLCHAVDDSPAANQAAGLTGGSGLVLSAGKHVIKGVTALEFVRQRHFLPRGDLDRVRRQQYFLTAAFRQVASGRILTELSSLGTAIEQSVYLDPTLNLTDLGSQLQNLSANNILSRTMPTTNATIDGQDVEQVDLAQVHAFMAALVTPPTPSPAVSTPAVSTPSTPAASPGAGSSAAATPSRPAPSASASASANAPIDAGCIN